jgi:hypothetical protein
MCRSGGRSAELLLNGQARMWPTSTSTSTDAKSSARHGYMITGNAGTTLLDAVRVWSPSTEKYSKAQAAAGLSDFPTPTAVSYGSGQNGVCAGKPSGGTPSLDTAARHGLLPGPKDGKRVLNPVFVEALMGWPLDWTRIDGPARTQAPFPPAPDETLRWARYLAEYPDTAPAVHPDAVLYRADRLRACGNGVVPQQAEAAFLELLQALNMLTTYTCESCGEVSTEDRYASLANPAECYWCYARRTGVKPTPVDPLAPTLPAPKEPPVTDTAALATLVSHHAPQELQNDLTGEATDMVNLAQELEQYHPSTNDEVQQLGAWLEEIRHKHRIVKDRLEEITKPFNQALRSLRDLFRPTLDAYDRAETVLKARILDGQQLIEANNRAAMHAAHEAIEHGDARSAALATSLLQPISLPEGMHTRKGWDFDVVDPDIVPRDFLTVDEKAVKAHIKQHGDSVQIPGIHIYPTTSVVAARRKA